MQLICLDCGKQMESSPRLVGVYTCECGTCFFSPISGALIEAVHGLWLSKDKEPRYGLHGLTEKEAQNASRA